MKLLISSFLTLSMLGLLPGTMVAQQKNVTPTLIPPKPSNVPPAAPADDEGADDASATDADGKNVHVHHHHYFYPPGQQPPYYYSQPTGQMNPSQQPYPQAPAYSPYGGGGGGWGGGGGGAGSTIAGSYMQGAGAMYAGAGQYNLLTSEAARQGQAARAEAMQNQMTYMNDYFLSREANRDYRRQLAGPTTTEQEAYDINNSRLPRRLTLDEFDPVTGKINWPDVLKRTEFDKDRAELDGLFGKRTHADSGIGSETFHDVQMATHNMMAKLHDDIKDMSPASYLLALKYIDGLQFEARFPPSTDPMASNVNRPAAPVQQ